MSRNLKEISAGGDVVAVPPVYLHSVSLTAGADAAVLIVRDGSTGAARLTLKAPAGSTTVWSSGDRVGVLFSVSLNTVLTGTGPVASFEYS